MENNFDLGSFYFLCKKNHFYFSSAKNEFFVKHLPKMSYKNGQLKFLKTIYDILCIIHYFLHGKMFLVTLQKIDKILLIQ
jgi:hypothetical protein